MKANSEKLQSLLKKINQDLRNEINSLTKRLYATLSPEEKKSNWMQNFIEQTLFPIIYISNDYFIMSLFDKCTKEQKTLINRCIELATLQHYTHSTNRKKQTVESLKIFGNKVENARKSDAFQQSAGGTGLNIFERIWDKIQAFFTKTPVRLKFFNQISEDIETYNNTIQPQQ